MGYVPKNVTVGELRQELPRLTFVDIAQIELSGAVETTVYKATQDLTDFDYLMVSCYGSKDAGASDGLVKVYFDTTLKKTFTFPEGGGAKRFYELIDVSGSTTEIIKVTMTSEAGGNFMVLSNLQMWGVET